MLNNLRKKIESAMYEVEKSDDDLTDILLSGASYCYNSAMRIRETLYIKKIKKSYMLPCYVISVGNITVGGTGKTPMVIYLAGLIKTLGYRSVVVSRGYGGEASSGGGIVSDGDKILLGAKKAGDEPFMMAKRLLGLSVPVVIGSDRYRAGMTAVKKFKPDVIILDDGFQHLRLNRDLDILLFDAKYPIGNGNILPRGVMREPASSMERADLFVLTRVEDNPVASPVQSFYNAVSGSVPIEVLDIIPAFTSTHKPHIHGKVKRNSIELIPDDGLCVDKDVFAFSGIAKNHEFRKTAESMGYNIKGYSEFPDHYLYSENDCNDIAASARHSCVKTIITTEKDYVKIAEFINLDFELIIISIEIDFGKSEKLFSDLIKAKIELKR